jgi:hypothetical protein
MLFGAADVHPHASFWLDVADKVVKAIALIVGASWALMNFKRGRTYSPRLEPKVSGEMFSKAGENYLLVNCRVKNVGQSVYKIEERGTGCEVISLSKSGRKRLDVINPFKDRHGWIEPGEQIEEPFILPIPDPNTFVALKLDLRVVSNKIAWSGSSMVKSTDILNTGSCELVGSVANEMVDNFGEKLDSLDT